MAEEKRWTPDAEEALKALIRQTIAEAGSTDPAELPHRVKQRLKGRATGDLDVEAYVKQVLKERGRNRR
ncbi:MAG: hypothetical protein GC153_10465 [Alphaproteobacteria bacterium]|nr:hypothetical protein [Alphaproteobacteria bacterium]